MAKAEFKLPEEFLVKISQLGKNMDAVAEKVLRSGGNEILQKTKSNLSTVIGRGTKAQSKSTGELKKALGLTAVRLDKNGNHNIKIGFAEPRNDGSSNAKIANILEYGSSKQTAKPFLKPAKNAAKKSAIKAMEETFENEVKKL
ncbi:MAG: HK97 gp10 family phage protein [Ruminococcaceae bacterium]|nr:HK97 gp10 family phage protein [Oscillospiraceae bacterium]